MINSKDFSPCVVSISHENYRGILLPREAEETQKSPKRSEQVCLWGPQFPLLLGGWWMVLATTEQVVIRGTWTISLDNKSFSAEIFVCMSIATLMRYQDLATEQNTLVQVPRMIHRYTSTVEKAGVLDIDLI